VSASGYVGGQEPFGAFDGRIGSNRDANDRTFSISQWSKHGRTGWVELRLNYYVTIRQIEFFNRFCLNENHTRAAHFTGSNGIALGRPFVQGQNNPVGPFRPSMNLQQTIIPVAPAVRTNVIRLNIIDGWGNYIGASGIVIHADVEQVVGSIPGLTLINTPQHLERIRQNPHGHFILTSNIDLTSTPTWHPIPYFHGTLDGAGFRILRPNFGTVQINGSDFAGLIGINRGVIRNLLIDSATMTIPASSNQTRTFAGGLVGVNYGEVRHPSVGNSRLDVGQIVAIVIAAIVATLLAWLIWVKLRHRKVWMVICYVLLMVSLIVFIYTTVNRFTFPIGEWVDE